MVWLGPRRSQVAFWRPFPNSAFERKPTGKSTGGHRKSTGGKTMFYRRPRGGGRENFWLFLRCESGWKRWMKVGVKC